MQRLASASRFPLLASGGIASLDDLRTLAAAGVAGAILGMALYTGTLDPRAVAEEFGT
jgi:phosphoribosylformimino-5-aminoimidazole carboxamide ribotide isomerase